jgi:hypothetical protein
MDKKTMRKHYGKYATAILDELRYAQNGMRKEILCSAVGGCSEGESGCKTVHNTITRLSTDNYIRVDNYGMIYPIQTNKTSQVDANGV